MNMMQDLALVYAERAASMSYEEFVDMVKGSLSVDLEAEEAIASADLYLSREIYSKGNVEEISEILVKNMMAVYNRRMNVIIQRTLPILKSIAAKEGVNMPDDAKIRIPVTDGRKVYGVLVNIKKTIESEGRELVRAISKSITLYRIDDNWKEHLREMDDLKQSVQNATYEQKDPLLIYKFESFNLFSNMLEELSKQVSSFLLRANIPLREGGTQTAEAPAAPRKPDMSQMNTSRTDLVTNAGEPKSKMPVHVEKQVGRNDPCPCGSGKKFKNCHGKGL
jgi:preprotein translocase subunit SecA